MKLIFVALTLLLQLSPVNASVTVQEAEALFAHFQNAYQLDLNERDETMYFNPPIKGTPSNWDYFFIHASYNYLDKKHFINVFGGVIQLPELTLDGLATIICHEIGHGLGGAPYKISGMSTEGQADYYATNICLKKVFKEYDQEPIIHDLKIIEKCQNDHYCIRAHEAVRDGVLTLIETKMNIEIDLFDEDPSVALSINSKDTFYPSPACRMMTFRSGILNLPKPACWYVEN